jgi:hypothetical protein
MERFRLGPKVPSPALPHPLGRVDVSQDGKKVTCWMGGE